MSDLIRRQDALDAINHICPIDTEYDCALLDRADVRCVLSDVPSAEPERHRGEWIEDEHERGYSECSKCGYIAVSVLSRRLYKFCPNCGADMSRGE